MKTQKTNRKMRDICPTLSVIILNINGLNSSIKGRYLDKNFLNVDLLSVRDTY